MHRVIHNEGGPESREEEVFWEARRAPERQSAPGVLEEADRATGKTKIQIAWPRQNPSSLGAAQMNNLDMQGKTVHRRSKKVETQEENHRTAVPAEPLYSQKLCLSALLSQLIIIISRMKCSRFKK